LRRWAFWAISSCNQFPASHEFAILVKRYGMEHAMLNLMQAVVPCSNVTGVTSSIMIAKVLKTFPPGTPDQNAMSEDGHQLQLGS